MKNEKYYLGLDIGTDSVGYAVTDEQYNLLKFHGEPAWGSHIFDAASLCTERRTFRTSRRRLDRRQQRVQLIQELFAGLISDVDTRFFERLKGSYLLRTDTEEPYTVFNDECFTDREYNAQYPTIHHLLVDLMYSSTPHDVRLVYLACAWLVAHRGHFLSNIGIENISKINDFSTVYTKFLSFFTENGYDIPWTCKNVDTLGEALKKKQGVNNKTRELVSVLFPNEKPAKQAREDFPFSTEAIVKLLAGGTCKIKDLFCNDEYDESGSISLGMDDEKLGEIMASTGDDYDLIAALRCLYDWGLLTDIIGECKSVSEAKVKTYDQHKKDLVLLKKLIKKYKPEKYNEVFREANEKNDNYSAYVYHTSDGNTAG